MPKISPSIGEITGEYIASGPAADALNGLQVDDRPDSTGYDRDSFGFRATDDDGDGCDVRDDVLARDLTDVIFSAAKRCQVSSGTLADPYTGKTILFVRGRNTSAAVQIDHVVALANAWQSGARDWTTAQRYRFGNDPYNLLAVDGPANQDKGSASAAYWLPTNGEYRCEYVARQIGVKRHYGLTVTTSETFDARRAARMPRATDPQSVRGGIEPIARQMPQSAQRGSRVAGNSTVCYKRGVYH